MWRRGRAEEPVAPATDTGVPAAPPSPYSAQYETIVAQGHEQPTPVIGAPCLVWHVGLWPRPKAADGAPCDPHDTADLDAQAAKETYDDRRRAWVADIDARLKVFECNGRWRQMPPRPQNRVKQFIGPAGVPGSGSITMTLWWRAPAGSGGHADAAIRVRLHCNLTPDFVTFSFYLDVNALWGDAVYDAAVARDPRRDAILAAVADIQDICRPVPLSRGLLPETLSAADDKRLTDARNVLYVAIWEQFADEMKCRLDQLAGTRGEVFANFRGLVLEAAGEFGGTPAEDAPFPRFSADAQFDRDGVEANGVVNAYWPLVRRITPAADYREFVVCGLLNWRALYVTALGSRSQYDEGEERTRSQAEKGEADICVRAAVVSGQVSATRDDDRSVHRRHTPPGNNHPVRYLMLTKAKSNGRQLGRIVERINAMGTLRLYALKDWHVIEAADTTIRILGQELDQITREWSTKRDLLDDFKRVKDFANGRKDAKYGDIRSNLLKADIPGRIARTFTRLWTAPFALLSGHVRQALRNSDANKALDIKYAVLADISGGLEGKLIRIGAALDKSGVAAVGGLHFRINRSRYHVAEFRRLLDSLQVGNVQTWMSYEQFVNRGLAPVFDYISNVGDRVHSLRERLLAVLETIETSALVGQSSATRHNTAELKRVLLIVVFMGATYIVQTGALTAALNYLTSAFPFLERLIQEVIGRLRGLA